MHLRSVLVRCPRRTRVDEKIMARLFAELAQARDALKPSEAELGKSGSNLNQIAHVLNNDRSPERIMTSPEATLQAHLEKCSTTVSRPSGIRRNCARLARMPWSWSAAETTATNNRIHRRRVPRGGKPQDFRCSFTACIFSLADWLAPTA